MKAKKLSSTKTLTREQWLEIRKTGITGTRMAGIMNVSPWETPRSVYLDLIGEKPEKDQTEPMYWGTKLEDIIAKEFQARTQTKVRKVNYILQHATYDFILGNIDRLIIDGKQKGVLEVKNVNAYSAEEWRDGAPEHYRIQLQFYLALTGLGFGYLAALVGGQKFVCHRYERDEQLIAQMMEAATEFWYSHVEPRNEPPVTERDTELLNALHATSEPDKAVHLQSADDSYFAHFSEISEHVKKQMQHAENAYDKHVNELKDIMKDAELLTVDGEKIATWKANKNGKRTFRLM